MSAATDDSAVRRTGAGRADAVWPWILVAVAFVVYWPSLSGGIVWNDRDYLTPPALQSAAGLARIWGQLGATEQYYPLLHSFFWLQHRLWGDQTLGYHLVTILLHAGSAVLFGMVLRRLAVPGAWLAALIFTIHPVHVESVAWITEQKNTLSLVFYLGAAWLYLRYVEQNRRSDYGWASALFVLSLLSKTVTVTLPAALLVVHWWRHGTLDFRRDRAVRGLVPWLVIGAAAGLFSSWVEQHYLGAEGESFNLDWMERILVGGRAIWLYLAHLVWPADLNFVYPRWQPDVQAAGQYGFPLAAAGLAAVLWAARRWSRAPLAAYLFFVGSLFPVLGFVNLYGALYSFVWDHWQYLPDLGPIALAGAGLALVGRWLAGRWRAAGAAALAVGAAGLGAASWLHCGMFQDEATLYRETLQRNPDCWLASYNLGLLLESNPATKAEAIQLERDAIRANPTQARVYYHVGRNLAENPATQAEAIGYLRTAIRLRPDYPEALVILAIALTNQPTQLNEAMAACNSAIALNRDNPEAHNALGNALSKLPGRLPEAIAEYRLALKLKPDAPQVHNNLALALRDVPGGMAEAAREFEVAARGLPDNPIVFNDLGVTLAQLPDRTADAVAALRTAVRLRPAYVQAHNNLGLALAQSPDGMADAVAEFKTALRLAPHYAEAKFNLGNLLAGFPERRSEAIGALEEAVRDKPDFANAHFALGILFAQEPNRAADAVAHFEAVLRVRPDLAEVHFDLGVLLAQMPGRRAEAIAHLSEAIRLRPDLDAARRLLRQLGAAE